MSPNHDSAPIVGTHVYTAAPGWKALMQIFGVVVTLGGLAAIWAIHEDPVITWDGAIFLNLFLLVIIAFGLICFYASFRYRLVLTRDGIEQRNVFTSRKLRSQEIASWRIIQVNNGPSIVDLIPRDGTAKPMQISRTMRTDQVFEDWLATFPNQTLLDAQRLEQEVQADPGYGRNPEERLRRLAQLRTLTEWLGRVGMGIALWGMFYPHPYLLVVAVLALCPLIGLAVVMWSGGLIHVDQKGNDKRPTVVLLLIMPAIVLGLRAVLDIFLLDWSEALIVAAVGGVVFALAAIAVDTEQRRWPAFLLMVVFGLPWSYGVATQLNIHFDRGAPQVFETTVIDKHQTTGKGHASYLTVAPWGPVAERGDEVVDRDFYDGTNVGDTVCVSLNKGALGWRWYWVDRCSGD